MSLGSLARIEVPRGYRLTDAEGARLVLAGMKNSLPDDVMAILAPESGQWFAVVEVTDIGYMKDADKETINTAKVLKAVRSRTAKESGERAKQGNSEISLVDWERPPKYDAEKHVLEWALRVEAGSAKTLDDSVLLLGRQMALQVTAVQPYPSASGASPLKQVMDNISFKEGQRYEDFQSGDKMARISLAELIVDDKRRPSTSRFSDSDSFALLCSAVPVCAVALLGGVLLYKRRRLGRIHDSITQEESIPAAVKVTAGPRKDGDRPDRNGKARRRRIVFDYPRFYTNMVMMESMSTTYGGTAAQVNGNGHTQNGHAPETNGNGNGNGNGHSAPPVQQALEMQLVAGLKRLIEEQNLLIEQQSRLMREKAKLLEEQTAMIKSRADMIQEQYPLKFD